MKKQIAGLFWIALVGLMLGQTPTSLKQKTSTAKDSIKKSKVNTVEPEVVLDTLETKPSRFKAFKKSVIASYYANKFNGKRTASGKKFSNSGYTAAHKKLPFGTKVRVTNEANGNSVIVEITDRGPFVRSKEIDLSKRAFMEIAHNKGSGMMRVTIELVEK